MISIMEAGKIGLETRDICSGDWNVWIKEAKVLNVFTLAF